VARGRVSALVGGAVGLAAAAAAAGIAVQRRGIESDRALISPRSAAALSPAPADRHRVVQTEDGIALHTEETGPLDAPLTVLFVHGFALNLTSFVLQRRALAEHFGDRVRLVFFDQRSHGRSGRSPAQGCTIEQLGRDLYSVLDQLVPAGPVVLVGHSMGGMTVMALAAAHPQLFAPGGQISAVALINTSSGDLRNVTLGMPNLLARLRGPVLPLVLRRAARNAALVEKGRALGKDLAWLVTKRLSFADPDVPPAVVAFSTTLISGTPVDVVADFYPTLMEHDGGQALGGLAGCPVLIMGSEHDALTPLTHSRELARRLPHAELIVADNSGHLLMLEHPEVVNQALIEFIEAAYPAAAGLRRAGA
jgi:pimeloyl-ACP methyl ester carboxylesterase